jgi:hypothetical protein
MKVTGPVFHGSYDTARGAAQVIAGLGWFVVVVGWAVALVSVGNMQAAGPFAMLGIAIGILIAVVGLLQVAAGQGVRAAVDAADYARQSLKLQIAQAEGLEEVDLQRDLPGSAGPRGSSSTLPSGFSRVGEREGVPIYSNGQGAFWVAGQYASSLENARAYALSVARKDSKPAS